MLVMQAVVGVFFRQATASLSAVSALLGGASGAFDRIFSLNPSASVLGRPSQMIMLPLSAVVSVVGYMVMVTPAAEICRRLVEQQNKAA